MPYLDRQIISQTVTHPSATVARFGGEEFAVILPGKEQASAQQVAEQIRTAAAGVRMPHPCSPTGVQTISLGVAAITPSSTQDIAELIGMADLALYRAKDLGRNQVAVA